MTEEIRQRSYELQGEMEDRFGSIAVGKEIWWIIEKLAALELENERLAAEVEKARNPEVYGGARR